MKNSTGPLYVHFNNECLKNFDDEEIYAPSQKFKYSKIMVDDKAKPRLSDQENIFCHSELCCEDNFGVTCFQYIKLCFVSIAIYN